MPSFEQLSSHVKDGHQPLVYPRGTLDEEEQDVGDAGQFSRYEVRMEMAGSWCHSILAVWLTWVSDKNSVRRIKRTTLLAFQIRKWMTAAL